LKKVKLKKYGREQLLEIQQLVGGWVQIIPIAPIERPQYVMMAMDEEGKIKRKDVNRSATMAAAGFLLPKDNVVGDVVLLEAHELI